MARDFALACFAMTLLVVALNIGAERTTTIPLVGLIMTQETSGQLFAALGARLEANTPILAAGLSAAASSSAGFDPSSPYWVTGTTLLFAIAVAMVGHMLRRFVTLAVAPWHEPERDRRAIS